MNVKFISKWTWNLYPNEREIYIQMNVKFISKWTWNLYSNEREIYIQMNVKFYRWKRDLVRYESLNTAYCRVASNSIYDITYDGLEKGRNTPLFLRYAMWIQLLSNKISTSCVWLYCTNLYYSLVGLNNSAINKSSEMSMLQIQCKPQLPNKPIQLCRQHSG